MRIPRDAWTDTASYGGFWRRLGASVIDGVILNFLVQPLHLAVGYGPGRLAIPLLILAAPVGWLYTTIAHGRYGYTVGKRAVELRVVDAGSLDRIGYGRAVRRDAPTILFSVIGTVLLIAAVQDGHRELFRTFDQRGTDIQERIEAGEDVSFGEIMSETWSESFGRYGTVFLIVALLNSAWSVAELLTMLSNRRRRAIHDLLGGTVVIRDPSISAGPPAHRGSSPAPPPPPSRPANGGW